MRRSTLVIVGVFIVALVLYLLVRPQPTATVRFVPAVPVPTTEAPSSSSSTVAGPSSPPG